MDYNQARDFLEQSMKFGSKLGLDRMVKLMDLLGNPGKNIKYIHIAGTNGKGSATTMIANCLAAEDFRTGVYTSPFIERFSERIRIIDGEEGLLRFSTNEEEGEISDEDFSIYITLIKKCVDIMLDEGFEHPTEFELVTAAAFMHYEDKNCDFVVLETGLGGRLDSTNIILNPIKCVITAIGYDHMDRLGNTIEEISFEKAGIIKAGADVVVYDPKAYTSGEEADKILAVFKKQAKEKNTKSFELVGTDKICVTQYNLEGQKFLFFPRKRKETIGLNQFDCDFNLSYTNQNKSNNNDYVKSEDCFSNEDYMESLRSSDIHNNQTSEDYIEFFTPLLGIYQPMNCAVVIESLLDLVSIEAIRKGISLTKWPARMELLRENSPLAFLDGGHNMQGAKALSDTLSKLCGGSKIVFLCGVLQDKEFEKMISQLLNFGDYKVEAVFCTRPDNPRAISSSLLAKTTSEILDFLPQSSYNRLAKVYYNDNVAVMLKEALEYTIAKGAVFVAFGSLYMAGEIRKKIMCALN